MLLKSTQTEVQALRDKAEQILALTLQGLNLGLGRWIRGREPPIAPSTFLSVTAV